MTLSVGPDYVEGLHVPALFVQCPHLLFQPRTLIQRI